MLRGAKKDPQIITSSWNKTGDPIDGVVLHEVANVPGNRGVLTEVFRPSWDSGDGSVEQIFQVKLFPGAISAWHCHAHAVDRLFASIGHLRIVLFDARPASPTNGMLKQYHLGESRPALLSVPPLVWHGVHNLGGTTALLLNAPSRAYNYEDPDHYRLPWDTTEIPFSWEIDPTRG